MNKIAGNLRHAGAAEIAQQPENDEDDNNRLSTCVSLPSTSTPASQYKPRRQRRDLLFRAPRPRYGPAERRHDYAQVVL